MSAKLEENCFQVGKCLESYHIAGKVASDEYECLEFCKIESECSWFTFFIADNFCELLKTCTTLDAELCPDCLTGQAECTPDAPACWIQGECQGVVEDIENTSSAEECLLLCASSLGCRWFTFFNTTLKCILFKTCPTIDESSTICTSGERRCIESTTQSPITTLSTTESQSTTTKAPQGKVTIF